MADSFVYLDHAATTPCDKRVVKKMLPYFGEIFGNPSGVYKVAREAKKGMDKSRKIIADFLNCSTDEVIFTNGGTESDNLAILGVARTCLDLQNLRLRSASVSSERFIGASADKRTSNALANSQRDILPRRRLGHIITTQIEHSAVLNSCRQLEKEGFEVTYLKPNREGIIGVDQVKKALRPETILVSIMYANNEIGTIQPIAEISKVIRDFGNSKLKTQNSKAYPLFHTDACQATQYLEMNVEKLGVDLLTFNGSKIYGPKGIGVLYIRSGIGLAPVLLGGEQEKGIRPGTENVPAIVGLGEAVRLIDVKFGKREEKLRDLLIDELLKIKNSELNGDRKKRLPNNVNIAFYGVEGEAAILYLDKQGIACSTGSACLSKTLEPSHVIMALGKGEEAAHSSLRFTLGRSTTEQDINVATEKVKEIIRKLREMSPINKSKIKTQKSK